LIPKGSRVPHLPFCFLFAVLSRTRRANRTRPCGSDLSGSRDDSWGKMNTEILQHVWGGEEEEGGTGFFFFAALSPRASLLKFSFSNPPRSRSRRDAFVTVSPRLVKLTALTSTLTASWIQSLSSLHLCSPLPCIVKTKRETTRRSLAFFGLRSICSLLAAPVLPAKSTRASRTVHCGPQERRPKIRAVNPWEHA